MKSITTEPSTELFADFHTKELKVALEDIRIRMQSVRAKRHWQREELALLKTHRRILSTCVSALDNAKTITLEQLTNVDAALQDYNASVN